MFKVEGLEYLKNPTAEKLEEVAKIIAFIGEEKPENIIVKGNVFKSNLLYFNPNNYESPTNIQLVDNLLYTIELNPSTVMIIKPDGTEYRIGWEDELVDEMIDVSDKIKDCIDTIRSGKKLDFTQDAFLRMHNIIE